MEIFKVEFLVWLGVMGAILGSFGCCQAWRIRRKFENQEKNKNEDRNKNKGKSKGEGKNENENELPKRSVCMHCGYRLRWYDNIPVVSWILLKGRCRKCGKKIGWAEIAAEILMAAAFVLVGVKFWGVIVGNGELTSGGALANGGILENGGLLANIVMLMLLLIMLVVFCILGVYDAKWGELPTKLLVAVNVLAVLYFVATAWGDGWDFHWFEMLSGVVILAGTYYLLYFFSKEKWVGGGDWILCLAIAVALSSWKLAFLELFLANFLALVVSLPGAILKKQKQVPFGPFLIIAFVMVLTLFSGFAEMF